MKKIFPLLMLAAALTPAKAQDFYDRSSVQTIEVFFGFSDWDAQLDALASTTEDYLLADSVRINGAVFDSVGVKYKGNSSYNANNQKNPLHIKLDFIHGSYDFLGYTDVKLQNGYQDPSMIREVLSYAILEQYMDCPKANFANVYVNGSLRGLYSNAQSIDERFNGDHYYSAEGSFFKCNPLGGAGPGGGGNPDLNFLGTDTTLYTTRYELQSDFGWADLVNMINVLNNDFNNIESVLDVDRALWMLAFNNVLVNLDSYSGAFRQNYYLYNDLNDRFVPTVWDLNMSFGGFPGGTGSGTLTNPAQLDPMSNSSSANHPLIVKMLGNAMYKRMYMAHLRTIVQEIFASGDYLTTANTLRSTIDASVQADPYKFFTYSQFQNSLTSNVTMPGPGGGMTQYGIQNLMDARVTYFNSNSNYLLVAPSIAAINVTNSSPNYGETITVTATCSGENTVYLGYRLNHILRFNRIQMFDDGNHNDGAAGDHVYGADITLNGNILEYYVYAENGNAGLFSPQRAEHEFYTLLMSAPLAQQGEVVINEILAKNTIHGEDEYGETNDWVELYNTTSTTLDISGLYLSDDLFNITKYQIPSGTFINGNSVLTIWADQDTNQYGLHANFKLGLSGESLYLNDGTAYYDVLDYGAQTQDVSYARCPDGGAFAYANPTFSALNGCYLTIEEETIENTLYPVPTNGNTYLKVEENVTILVVDITGREVFVGNSTGTVTEIPSSGWQSGYYRVIVTCEDGRTASKTLIKE
jgi:hypothetical protein